MYYFDSHSHINMLNATLVKEMAIANIAKVVSPIHIAGPKPLSPELLLDMWDVLLEQQLDRVKKLGIDAYAQIGISMVAAPRSGLDMLFDIMPRYLKKANVVAIGEVGFESTSLTFPDHEYQKRLLEKQIDLACEYGLTIDIHTSPFDEKYKTAKESIELCKAHGLPMDRLIVDHCTDATLDLVLDAGAYAAISVQPWRNVTPAMAAEWIIRFGGQRMLVDSDSGDLDSDPLSVPKVAYELRVRGASEELICSACWKNPHEAYRLPY